MHEAHDESSIICDNKFPYCKGKRARLPHIHNLKTRLSPSIMIQLSVCICVYEYLIDMFCNIRSFIS